MAEDLQRTILDQYDTDLELYSRFTEKIENLVVDILRDEGIRTHSVTSRIKERSSLHDKLRSRDSEYSDLADITDIAGIRITTYFADDVDTIAARIESELSVDWQNSTDKRVALDPDRFGYLSLHHIVSFDDNRAHLSEYHRFDGLKAEIQTRSVLQHAWAEIEHDLGYKTREGVPKGIRRRFSRLAGLLELADQEFQSIRDELTEYERTVSEKIRKSPQSVEIDKASLTAFYSKSPIVKEIDQEIASTSSTPLRKEHEHLVSHSGVYTEADVAKLKLLQIETIEDLEIKLSQHKQETLAFVSEWFTEEMKNRIIGGHFPPGISIFYLLRVLAAISNDIDMIEKLESLTPGKEPDGNLSERAEHILNTYQSISRHQS